MEIIGRDAEKRILKNCMDSKKPAFLAVYGRRRVGKTYLVREYFGDSIVFSVSGSVKTSMRRQLRNFDDAFNEYSGTAASPASDWFDAFRSLKKYIKGLKRKGKKVIFIDELPWLATQKSGFLSALDYFWNTFVSTRPDLILVICGSATSWIIDNVINDRGGLHNRVTRQLWIEPFSLGECEMYYRSKGIELNRVQIAELYMILGGIPFYMDYVEKGLSSDQIVDSLFFAARAPLANEFDNLYAALFKNPERHIRIIESLGKSGAGMTQKELFADIKSKPGGSLTKALKELEQCGFIRRYRDFTKKTSGQYFQLTDFFTLFYLKHIKNRIGLAENYWQSQGRKGGRNAWNGIAFERVCAAHIPQVKAKIGISGVTTETSAWRSKYSVPAVQIDLVISRDDGIINLCEMKFTEKPFNIDAGYDNELIIKRETFREETGTRKALHITMVTASGLTQGSYIGTVQAQVLLDDLFHL
jgi:AAA+ ATPase superfamily predicted ATPase